MIHRHHAKEVVVEFGDRLSGPVFKDVTRIEIFEISAKWAIVCCHDVPFSNTLI
jgi:hypothetical protein